MCVAASSRHSSVCVSVCRQERERESEQCIEDTTAADVAE